MSKVDATFYQDLEYRGIIKQVTDPELEKLLKSESVTLYIGFDPTADSLHVGSLFGLILLKRFQLAGHRPIAVVGGATGMIGDPSGKSAERSLLNAQGLAHNVAGIRRVMDRVLNSGTNPVTVVDNSSWCSGVSFIEFLRDIGKHFTVNHMMAKESVRARLEDREHGISYTEFSYMLLQAYDFYVLNQKENCRLQCGGSDQWGNIVAGIDLIRRKHAHSDQTSTPAPQVFGFTHPLVTKSDGTKFGKSESGTVWLSADRTTPYALYQFFIQTADADVVTYLKYFTLLPHVEIERLAAAVKSAPEKREAQTALAREVVTLVHGASALESALGATQALFGEDIVKLDESALLSALTGAPSFELPHARLEAPLALVDLLAESGLCSSKGAARKDIQGGGISLNNKRVTEVTQTCGLNDLIHGKYVVLRKGKKNFLLVKVN